MSFSISNIRPQPDQVLVDIADYVVDRDIPSTLAYDTARHCLMDSLGCAMEALTYPALHQAAGAARFRNHGAGRRENFRYTIRARSGTGGIQYRHDDSLARFQRYLAGRGMGASIG